MWGGGGGGGGGGGAIVCTQIIIQPNLQIVFKLEPKSISKNPKDMGLDTFE